MSPNIRNILKIEKEIIMCKRYLNTLLTSVAVIILLLVLTSSGFAQGRSAQAFERVRQVQTRNTPNLLSREDIVGTAIGMDQSGQPILHVLIDTPVRGNIPRVIEGVPVQLVITGKFYALVRPEKTVKVPVEPVDPTARFERPVPIGVSTGHPDITAGTIGCRVKDNSGNVYALSNNHVYANCNLAEIDDIVLQPGTYDGGKIAYDSIGTLYDFQEIDFDYPVNTIDAAIALVTENTVGISTPANGYGTPKSQTMSAYINQKVKKYGRTTGLTKGTVVSINAALEIGYGSAGTAIFVNQIVISPGTFSDGGDSGSLIVADGIGKNKQDDRKPVGLLFAGSSLYTIANPIDAVLSTFGVSIDGE